MVFRVLVYSRLKERGNDKRIVEHLKKHRQIAKALGLPWIPDRTTIERGWRRYFSLPEEVFDRLSDLLQILAPKELEFSSRFPI